MREAGRDKQRFQNDKCDADRVLRNRPLQRLNHLARPELANPRPQRNPTTRPPRQKSHNYDIENLILHAQHNNRGSRTVAHRVQLGIDPTSKVPGQQDVVAVQTGRR